MRIVKHLLRNKNDPMLSTAAASEDLPPAHAAPLEVSHGDGFPASVAVTMTLVSPRIMRISSMLTGLLGYLAWEDRFAEASRSPGALCSSSQSPAICFLIQMRGSSHFHVLSSPGSGCESQGQPSSGQILSGAHTLRRRAQQFFIRGPEER